MDKPLRAAGRGVPDYPRMASKTTAAHWRAHWNAVEALGWNGDRAPAIGEGLIPWAAYLRGRGLNPAADALGKATVDGRFARECRRSCATAPR